MNKLLIQQVFSEMDYGTEVKHFDNVEAKQWIEEHKQFNHFVNGSMRTTFDSSQYDKLIKCPLNAVPIKQMIRLAEIIKKRKTFITALCTELKPCCSQKGLLLMIDELIYHIEYCMQDKLLNLKSKKIDNIELKNFECDDPLPLRFISSHVIPAMANGWQGLIFVVDTNVSFFLLFAELCKQAGFSDGSVNVTTLSLPTKGISMKSKVDMLIFEDSDLHYAVGAIEQAVWNIAEMHPFSLNHVLVQESVSKAFKTILLDKLKHNADRHVNTFVNEEDTIREINSALSTKDFSEKFLLEKKVAVLFEKLEKLDLSKPVPVFSVNAFRTEAEAISMFTNGNHASVWVENGASAQRIANQLQAPCIWVNGYGLIHPAMSLACPLGYGVKNLNMKEADVKTLSSFKFGINDSLTIFDFLNRNTKCINTTKIFSDAAKNFETAALEKLPFGEEIPAFCTAIAALKNEYVTTEGFRVDMSTLPRGIILIELFDDTSIPNCEYAINAAVAFGNAVILSVPDKLYPDVINLLDSYRFPNFLVTVYRNLSNDDKNLLLGLDKIHLWTFNGKKMYHTMQWNYRWKFTNVENIIDFSTSQIKAISTKPKFVWTQNT